MLFFFCKDEIRTLGNWNQLKPFFIRIKIKTVILKKRKSRYHRRLTFNTIAVMSPSSNPPPDPDAPNTGSKPLWPYIAAFAVFVAMVVIALPLISLYDGRDNNLEWARTKSLSQARVLSENASRALEAVDLILLDVAGRARRNLGDAAGGDGFNQTLADIRRSKSQIQQLLVTGAQGKIIHASDAKWIGVDIGKLKSFKFHLSAERDSLFAGQFLKIGRPGRWFIAISRANRDPAGRFLGVVVAMVGQDYFHKVYELFQSRLGFDSLLISGQGRIFATTPGFGGSDLSGEHIGETKLYARLNERASGVFEDYLENQDHLRIIAFAHVTGFPFIALATIPRSVALANWRKDARNTAIIAALALIAICGFSWVAIRQVKLRQLTELGLIAARREAERATRAKSEFLSSMSHELRTPLNAVLGFAQMLEFNPKQPLTEQQKFSVDHILSGGRHLLELINDVLDLAKVESGKLELKIEDIELDRVFERCRDIIDPLAEKNGISLTMSTDTGIAVRADKTRIDQVLLNLMSNAVKYNRQNGSLTVTHEATPNSMIRISIIDTGPGIPEDKIDLLFEPFARLGAENSKIEGTGIGLTITKRLIEAMGGRTGVESEVGVGSTFWFEIPESQIHRSRDEELIDTSRDAVTIAATLLYIEDNPDNFELISIFADTIPGLSLLSATTAESGLEIAEREAIDIILMDVNLPGMSGIEAMTHIRANDKLKDIPVIGISASALPDDVARGLDAGFLKYLTKPVNIRELRDTLEQTMADLKGPASRAPAPTSGSAVGKRP